MATSALPPGLILVLFCGTVSLASCLGTMVTAMGGVVWIRLRGPPGLGCWFGCGGWVWPRRISVKLPGVAVSLLSRLTTASLPGVIVTDCGGWFTLGDGVNADTCTLALKSAAIGVTFTGTLIFSPCSTVI